MTKKANQSSTYYLKTKKQRFCRSRLLNLLVWFKSKKYLYKNVLISILVMGNSNYKESGLSKLPVITCQSIAIFMKFEILLKLGHNLSHREKLIKNP